MITGASAGFGAAAARKFAANGRRIVIAARREERISNLAEELGRIVDAAPDLELMAPVQLNVTAFRYVPQGDATLTEAQLDALNAELGEAVLADGRFLVGTSKLGPRTIFRPCFSNWRTQPAHVAEFAAVVQELGAKLSAS